MDLLHPKMQEKAYRMQELAKMYHDGFFGDMHWHDITKLYLRVLPRRRSVVINSGQFGKSKRKKRKSKSKSKRKSKKIKKVKKVKSRKNYMYPATFIQR